jgi:hypothetical protein
LSGIFLKNQKDCGQAAMTESDNAVALLMTLLVITASRSINMLELQEILNQVQDDICWSACKDILKNGGLNNQKYRN